MMLMKNLKNKILIISIGITLIILGYAIAKYINTPYFVLSKEIDISNLINIAITIWLAIFITDILEKKNNDNRIEKDMMISRIEDLYHITSSIQVESNTGQIHLSEASSALKRINTSLSSVYKLIEKCHFVISEEIKNKLKQCLSDLRDLLTSTPAIPQDKLNSKDIPIEIKESIVYYNKERISQIEVKIETLKNLLIELQIEINKK